MAQNWSISPIRFTTLHFITLCYTPGQIWTFGLVVLGYPPRKLLTLRSAIITTQLSKTWFNLNWTTNLEILQVLRNNFQIESLKWFWYFYSRILHSHAYNQERIKASFVRTGVCRVFVLLIMINILMETLHMYLPSPCVTPVTAVRVGNIKSYWCKSTFQMVLLHQYFKQIVFSPIGFATFIDGLSFPRQKIHDPTRSKLSLRILWNPLASKDTVLNDHISGKKHFFFFVFLKTVVGSTPISHFGLENFLRCSLVIPQWSESDLHTNVSLALVWLGQSG